ncbi:MULTISPECIES: flagellar biosynthetic protein FliO [Paenibacillus]|jgi:flagellar protein FliO/FliZ|uniref:Flagellar protein n=1 Tax=Paenibacillus borealis TaxID=160799 RepID=A0ABX3HH74_PAEBO|nr:MULTISPECIES: flagellar biosynthetic protein FliO [Paenibacillus]AIQ18986.1 flagellar protein [Paenibacillus sp. FSL H7-0357]OMD49926.1 flagellar protein [Paenibacillus borealis]
MPANSEPLGNSNPLLNLLNVIFVLAAIVILIVLLIRFLGRRNQTLMSGRSIRTLGALGLGPNKSVQIIEIGGSLYMIGVGENISMLDKITDPAEVALIISTFEEESSGQNNFLVPLISKIKAKVRGEVPSQEIELSETSSFYETLQSKLALAPERNEKMEELLRDDALKDESRDL